MLAVLLLPVLLACAAAAPPLPPPCTADEDCLAAGLRCLPSPGGAPCTLDYAFNETGTCACLPQECRAFTYAPPQPGRRQWLQIGDSISLGLLPDLAAQLPGWDVLHVGSPSPINCDNAYLAARCVKGWLGANASRWDVVSYNAGLHDLALPDNEHLSTASYAKFLASTLAFLTRTLRPDATLLWASTTPVPTDPPANCTLLPGRLESAVLEYNQAAAGVVAALGGGVRQCDLHGVITSYCGSGYATCNITQCGGPHFTAGGWKLLASAMARCGTQPPRRAAAAPPAPPRHVLFVLIDDAGFSEFSYKGPMYNISGPLFPTPTLDALALAGVRLESLYTNKLCSPSRGGILSGRYAYTTGGNAEVIVDGQPDQLPTNIRTVADLLSAHGWQTSAFGKWDLGMTSWGCTPTCRGFQHFSGFYNAYNDYFSHHVGDGLDLRSNFLPNANETGVYMTELITARVQQWITATTASAPGAPTFAYVAHQAIHAPQQVPEAYISGNGCERMPADNPTRRVACGQMAAVDASMASIVATYKALGLWEDTLVVVMGDNGPNPDTGGQGWPLRGMKATLFEGGMRAAAFVSGAGLAPAVAGSVSQQFFSHVDLLPMLVQGVAGIDGGDALLPKHPYQPPPPPLDGVDIWAALSTGAPSPRTEALLTLDPYACFKPTQYGCATPGMGAYRRNQWKLLVGHVGDYAGPGNVSSDWCGEHSGSLHPLIPGLPMAPNSTPPFCPAGWVTPEGAAQPPPGECPGGTPCQLSPTSSYSTGGLWLFDVVEDMEERHDVAAQHPDVVADLLARLQAWNATRIPQSNSPTDPRSDPKHWGGVWTPWVGNPDPAACDPNATSVAPLHSALDGLTVVAGSALARVTGWAWSLADGQAGRAHLNVSVQANGEGVGVAPCNLLRPRLVPDTGAPDGYHGFSLNVTDPVALQRLTQKRVRLTASAAVAGEALPVGEAQCYDSGERVAC
jgi:arylsulfatase B